MGQTRSVEEMWSAFMSARPELVGPDDVYAAWHFCDNESDADELAELVVSGRKRATAGALWSYEADGDPLPEVGDFSVITDWAGRPRCVIRATSVEVVAFGAVSEEFAATEGEGDGSLAYWREAHVAAFTRELERMGKVLDDATPVVCECFEVVYGVGGLDC